MSYATKIEKGIITQKDLTAILGISKQQVTRLLSFKRIPKELFNAIKDFKYVSARTAEELCRLAAKDSEYLEILIELAPKIASGVCGHKTINKEIKKRISNSKGKLKNSQKITNKDGRHLFTWRLDNNGTPSIHFPQDIISLFNTDAINFDKLTEEFRICLANILNEIKDESPRGD